MSRLQARSIRILGALLLVALPGFPSAGSASEGAAWTWIVESGVFDVEEGEVPFLGFEARHRPRSRLWGVFPLVGGLVTGDDSVHLRLGLGRDFPLGERVLVTVSSAGGYWERGEGPDLGHDLEFRSALDVHCRLRENMRLGLTLAHLSNAGIADHNPGTETLSISLAWRP